jgi:hypothetical protein
VAARYRWGMLASPCIPKITPRGGRVHLLALLAVVGVPIGMMVGAVGLQQLEQRLLGSPTQDDKPGKSQPSSPVRRAPPRPSGGRRVSDAEPATVPLLLPRPR